MPSKKKGMPQKARSSSFGPGNNANPRGPIAHVPSDIERRSVEAMAAVGTPQAEIAKVLEMSEKTLREHYRRELDTAAIKANARVGQSLYAMAVGDIARGIEPNFQAAKWWSQARMGWKAQIEITSADLRTAVSVAARFLADRESILEDDEAA